MTANEMTLANIIIFPLDGSGGHYEVELNGELIGRYLTDIKIHYGVNQKIPQVTLTFNSQITFRGRTIIELCELAGGK